MNDKPVSLPQDMQGRALASLTPSAAPAHGAQTGPSPGAASPRRSLGGEQRVSAQARDAFEQVLAQGGHAADETVEEGAAFRSQTADGTVAAFPTVTDPQGLSLLSGSVPAPLAAMQALALAGMEPGLVGVALVGAAVCTGGRPAAAVATTPWLPSPGGAGIEGRGARQSSTGGHADADQGGQSRQGTTAGLVAEIVDSLHVSASQRAEHAAVHLELKGPLLAGTRVTLVREGQKLRVELEAGSHDGEQALRREVDGLREALNQALPGSFVELRVGTVSGG